MGAGAFADYADIRANVQQQYMIDLPEHISAWFIVLPALIWIAAGATHKEVKRQRVGPRIVFDAPRILASSLLFDQALHKTAIDNHRVNRLLIF